MSKREQLFSPNGGATGMGRKMDPYFKRKGGLGFLSLVLPRWFYNVRGWEGNGPNQQIIFDVLNTSKLGSTHEVQDNGRVWSAGEVT